MSNVSSVQQRLEGMAAPALGSPPKTTREDRQEGEWDQDSLGPLKWRMLNIFRSVLGQDNLGLEDDFFEWGGDSFIAGRLIHKVEREFGKVLPLASIIEGPTPAQLARRVAEGNQGGWKCLVPIRTDGQRPALFCLHAGGLEILMFRPLANLLKEGRPVFGLQPPGLKGGKLYGSIPEMARQYVTEIREAQPSGPYYLLAYCFGVRMVVPMAKYMANELGEPVSLVVVDTGPPVNATEGSGELPSVFVLGRGLVKALILGQFTQLPERLRRAGSVIRYRWKQAWVRRFGSETARHRERVEEATLQMAGEPIRDVLNASCLLIRSSETAGRREKDFHMDWEKYTSGFQYQVIETRHRQVLDPDYVGPVAQSIDDYLLKQDDASTERAPGATGE